jgi:hypothetical protein
MNTVVVVVAAAVAVVERTEILKLCYANLTKHIGEDHK